MNVYRFIVISCCTVILAMMEWIKWIVCHFSCSNTSTIFERAFVQNIKVSLKWNYGGCCIESAGIWLVEQPYMWSSCSWNFKCIYNCSQHGSQLGHLCVKTEAKFLSPTSLTETQTCLASDATTRALTPSKTLYGNMCIFVSQCLL